MSNERLITDCCDMLQHRWMGVRSCKKRTLGDLWSLVCCNLQRLCSARLILAVVFVVVLSFLLRGSPLLQVKEISFRQHKYVFTTETILEVRSSAFHNITVAQSGSLRMLRFDMIGTEGVIHLDHPQLILFGYMRLKLLCLLWNSEPERILILGLGAGILPRIFHQLSPNTSIDVVEVDRIVLEMAEKYFLFSQSNAIRVYIEDGRHFLERQPSNRYDVILIDAFTVNGHIPHALRTIECLGEYRRILKSTGLLAANFIYEQEDRYRQTFARALFEHVYRVDVEDNYILFGLHKRARVFNEEDFETRARMLDHSKPLPDFNWVQESQHFRNRGRDQWNVSATIFTDDVDEDLQSAAESQ